MLSLMGFDLPDEIGRVGVEEGRIAIEGDDPEPECSCYLIDPCCGIPAGVLPDYPKPPPSDSTPDDLILITVQALECCFTDGPPGGSGDPVSCVCCLRKSPGMIAAGYIPCCEICCGGLCDDNNPCTHTDMCTDNGCLGTPKDCDDGDRCNTDSCSDGTCFHSEPPTACCKDPDPCCDSSDPCCGNPNRCCNDDNPCCRSPDPCCNIKDECCGNPDRCCNDDNPCCGSPDPCCNSEDPCCGDSDRCCNDDNPCCGSTDPCCNSEDPCCGNPSRCCNDDNPCCGSPDPCCNSEDPCCGDSDRCCNDDNPCCGSPDPCCYSEDPCCGDSDFCCNPDNPCCEDPCLCTDCDDGDPCTDDNCSDGVCDNPPKCTWECCEGECCPEGVPCVEGLCCESGVVCGGQCCPGGGTMGMIAQAPVCCNEACCMTGMICCGECCEPQNCCGDKCCTPGQECCADGTCCSETCDECIDYGDLSGGTVDVTPDPACLGDTLTFTVSGVVDSGGQMRENCDLVNIPPGTIEYTWEITKPDTEVVTGSGSSADVVADLVGDYCCTFTATSERDCPPDSLDLDPADKTLAFTATLTLNPSSIAASTVWPDMPAGLDQSDITVTWDPPECVGSLEIVEIVGTLGYVPPENGTLEKVNDTLWRYRSYSEPLSELCAKSVKVWIGAMQGDEELARKSIMVLPVHTFLTTGANTNFPMDYDYISWKYAAVLATTQGGFTPPVNFKTTTGVCCPWPFCNAYACTDIEDGTVVFGTSTFTGSENQAASIIGHELLHTTGANECAAYTWEFDHDTGTGIFQCDTSYLADVVQMMNCECSGINCP